MNKITVFQFVTSIPVDNQHKMIGDVNFNPNLSPIECFGFLTEYGFDAYVGAAIELGRTNGFDRETVIKNLISRLS